MKKIDVFNNNLHANVINWGLGLQSTAMIELVNDDILPRPDAIVFCDPMYERAGSYETLDYWKPRIEDMGIPLHVLSEGNIKIDMIEQERVEMPFWINASRYETIEGKLKLYLSDIKKDWYKRQKKDNLSLFGEKSLEQTLHEASTVFGQQVVSGKIKSGWMNLGTTLSGRQCTKKYKIKPTNEFIQREFGASKAKPVGSWLGITTDEWTRMKTSPNKYSVLLYPFISLEMSRDDCEVYLLEKGLPLPPKSACVGCPYHSNATWAELSKEEIADVAQLEEDMIQMIANSDLKYLPYFVNGVRTSNTMMPIDEVEFDATEDNETPCTSIAGCFL